MIYEKERSYTRRAELVLNSNHSPDVKERELCKTIFNLDRIYRKQIIPEVAQPTRELLALAKESAENWDFGFCLGHINQAESNLEVSLRFGKKQSS